MSEEFNVYDHKHQLPHGVWVFNKGSKEWSDEMNANMEALDTVLEHKTLTIKDSEGTTLVEFDNTEDKELTLPEATVEVDIKKLTIKDSEGATLVEFDGSTDKELTLPEVEIPEIPEVDIKKLTIKDSAGTTLVEYNGSTDKVLTLPEAQVPQTQGSSFTYNTTKDYTTLYFTEEALQTLGYTGLSDSNALKYRTVIGSQNLKKNASSRPASPEDSFGVSVSDSKNRSIVSLNPNLRPNVGAVKSVNYLGSVFSYIINMIDNLAGVDAPHGLAEGEYLVCSIGRVDASNYVKNRIVASVDNYSLMNDPHYQEYRNATVAELVKFSLNSLNDLYSLDEEFKEGDKLVISIAKRPDNEFGEYNGSDAGISLDTFNNDHTFSDGSATSIVLGDLCTYEELQDSITPISVQVVPVQVPATKIVYHDYEDTDATDFNVYTYLLYAYAKDGFTIIRGQNIGNGIIIGAKNGNLSYLSVIEGTAECGSTTFSEIYPAQPA